MNPEGGYQPSAEEIAQAEQSMTERQKYLSREREKREQEVLERKVEFLKFKEDLAKEYPGSENVPGLAESVFAKLKPTSRFESRRLRHVALANDGTTAAYLLDHHYWPSGRRGVGMDSMVVGYQWRQTDGGEGAADGSASLTYRSQFAEKDDRPENALERVEIARIDGDDVTVRGETLDGDSQEIAVRLSGLTTTEGLESAAGLTNEDPYWFKQHDRLSEEDFRKANEQE